MQWTSSKVTCLDVAEANSVIGVAYHNDPIFLPRCVIINLITAITFISRISVVSRWTIILIQFLLISACKTFNIRTTTADNEANAERGSR